MSRNSRSRDRQKQLKEAKKEHLKRKQAAHRAEHGYITLGGLIENRECRLDLLICHPTDNNLNRQVRAVVDTGCTGVAIRRDIVTALNLPVVDRVQVHHMGGVVETDAVLAKMVVGKDGRIASLLRKMSVGDVGEMADEMLFGMDALSGGILTVDLVNHEWSWKLVKLGKVPA